MCRKSSALFFLSFHKVFIRHSRNASQATNVPVAVSHYSFANHQDGTKSGAQCSEDQGASRTRDRSRRLKISFARRLFLISLGSKIDVKPIIGRVRLADVIWFRATVRIKEGDDPGDTSRRPE